MEDQVRTPTTVEACHVDDVSLQTPVPADTHLLIDPDTLGQDDHFQVEDELSLDSQEKRHLAILKLALGPSETAVGSRPTPGREVEVRTSPAINYQKEEYMFPKYIQNHPSVSVNPKSSFDTTKDVKNETTEKGHLEDYFDDPIDIDEGFATLQDVADATSRREEEEWDNKKTENVDITNQDSKRKPAKRLKQKIPEAKKRKKPGRKPSGRVIEIRLADFLAAADEIDSDDEVDDELRLGQELLTVRGSLRVRAERSALRLPQVNPVLNRGPGNGEPFRKMEDFLVMRSDATKRFSFDDKGLTPETRCALRHAYKESKCKNEDSDKVSKEEDTSQQPLKTAPDRHVYGCMYCNFMGIKQNWLKHLRSKHRDVDGLVFCTYFKFCQMPFDNLEWLEQHVASVHKTHEQTGPKFTPVHAYQDHQPVVKTTKPVKTRETSATDTHETSGDRLSADEGVKDEVPDCEDLIPDAAERRRQIYTCMFCDFTDTSRSKWAGHMLNQHGTAILYQCNYTSDCVQTFDCEEKLAQHTLEAHSKLVAELVTKKRASSCFVCSYCGKEYATRKGCREHEALRHAPQKLRHRCEHVEPPDKGGDRCTAAFYSAKELTVHKRKHTGELPFICGYCGQGYRSKATLVQHEKQQHFNSEPTVECEICHKTMKKRNLDYHLKRHEGYFQIPCKVCGKTFTSVGARNRHEKIHNQDKQHSCRFCGKAFVQKSNLQAHERIHTGERPFTCKHCGDGFMQHTRRNVHQMNCTAQKKSSAGNLTNSSPTAQQSLSGVVEQPLVSQTTSQFQPQSHQTDSTQQELMSSAVLQNQPCGNLESTMARFNSHLLTNTNC